MRDFLFYIDILNRLIYLSERERFYISLKYILICFYIYRHIT